MHTIFYRALMAMVLSVPAAYTFADGRDWANYKSTERTQRHHHHESSRPAPRYWGNQHPYQHGYYQFRYTPSTQYEYRYQRRFYPGEQLPTQYRNSRYYLDDWHSYHLYEPPHGYRWMIIDGHYLLVSTPNFTISVVR